MGRILKYNGVKSSDSRRTNGNISSVPSSSTSVGIPDLDNNSVSNSDFTNNVELNRTIWGQLDTGQDINKDILVGGNGYIIDTTKDTDPRTLEDMEDIFENGNEGNLYVEKGIQSDSVVAETGKINNISGYDLNYANGNIIDFMSTSADIESLTSSIGYIKSLSGSDLNYLRGIINELQSKEITTENLTVTKSAHFFELIIDKIKSVGGAVVLTPADGFTVESIKKVVSNPDFYNLYWKANDGNKARQNMWKVGDQALCQTFNNASLGTSYNVSNKFYWAVVSAVGTEKINGEDYHYIQLNGASKQGVLNPEIGDEIVMLGYRGTDDESRQSAIYISAYDSIDASLKAPFICHYKGINDFNISNHKYTWFAANGNTIQGNLLTQAGTNIEESISAIKQTSDSIRLMVANLKGLEYDLYDPDNWLWGGIVLSSDVGTPFEETIKRADDVSLKITMTFNHLIPLTSSLTVSCAASFRATIAYFDIDKNYLGTYENYSGEKPYNIPVIPDAYYIGFYLTAQRTGTIVQIISSIPQGITDSAIRIIDTKVASSLIEQTANQILLKVDDIALRIDNQKIVLDGDTEINGSLTMDNSDQGFILKGDEGIAQISPQSIGTFDQFASSITNVERHVFNINSTMTNTSMIEGESDITYRREYVINKDLGYIDQDVYLEFTNKTLTYSANDSGTMTAGLQQYQIYCGSELVKTYNSYVLNQENFMTYMTDYSGNYSIKITLNFSCTRTKQPDNKDIVNTSTVGFIGQLSYSIGFPTSSKMLIGYDGIGANFGNNKIVYIGPNESTFLYSSTGLKITDAGLQRYNPNTFNGWTNINTKKIYKLTGNSYTLTEDVDVVIKTISGYNTTVILPTNAATGKTVYFKNRSTSALIINNPNNRLMASNSYNYVSNITLGSDACFFIFDGDYWLQFNCN